MHFTREILNNKFTIAFANVSSSDTWILAITQSSIRQENRLGNSVDGKISVFSTSGNTAICKQKGNYSIRQRDNSTQIKSTTISNRKRIIALVNETIL